MRVLITRPIDLAVPLAKKLTAMGMEVELLPTLEIHPTPLQSDLQSIIKILDTFDMAIWISQAAVKYSLPLIHSHWHNPSNLRIQWAAIGASTEKALKQEGLEPIISPIKPPYESESLLALTEFQTVSVTEKKILILKGNGGRNLLTEVLEQRGAKVKAVESYQRSLPKIDMVERLHRWHHTSMDVIVTTSKESLQNLMLMVGTDVSWLKNIHLVVVGSRMLDLAKQLNFNKIQVAPGADDEAILSVLLSIKEEDL